jgi:hypothetical protein
MADPVPNPSPNPQPAPKPKATRGIINKSQQDDLDKAALVAAAAGKPEYAAQIAAHDIDAASVTQLNKDIVACKKRIGKAVDLTTNVDAATEAEKEAQNALVALIRKVQAAEKQKNSRAAPGQLADYFIGEDITVSRAFLLEVADAILGKLNGNPATGTPPDVLPGIDAAKIAALQTARDAYEKANTAQTTAQSLATQERDAIASDIAGITARRVAIQYAADGEWGADNPDNAPIRREFQLPANRPFTG